MTHKRAGTQPNITLAKNGAVDGSGGCDGGEMLSQKHVLFSRDIVKSVIYFYGRRDVCIVQTENFLLRNLP